MTPEERALQRFVKEKQKTTSRKGALYDLEDEGEDELLTHLGASLSFDRSGHQDDFNEDISTSEEHDVDQERPLKRRRLSEDASLQAGSDADESAGESQKKKTKKEVMEEVMKKSKLHKYERQQAKEDDDDLRAELDKGLPDLYALMRRDFEPREQSSQPKPQEASMNPDRAALLNGKDRSQADKEYDELLRQMAFDQRSKPTERTLTEEERLRRDAERLQELEEKRLRRMTGKQSDDEEHDTGEGADFTAGEDEEGPSVTFNLGKGLSERSQRPQLDVEDEDEFFVEDIVADNPDLVLSREESEEQSTAEFSDEEEDEFVREVFSKEEAGRIKHGSEEEQKLHGDLAYTYSCPLSHRELLVIMEGLPVASTPTVVQRIRALYHPKLHIENKAKLAVFSTVLVDHVSSLANSDPRPPFAVLEALIRHIHSLAKSFKIEIGRAFRSRLKSWHETRGSDPMAGDLIIATAVTSLFPTSDHFHQVVTPMMLCLTKYLAQSIPRSLSDLAIGSYISTLCLQSQELSRRYIPEVLNYVLNVLHALAPAKKPSHAGPFLHQALPRKLQIQYVLHESKDLSRKIRFWDMFPSEEQSAEHAEELKLALLDTNLILVAQMVDIWMNKSAICETLSFQYWLTSAKDPSRCPPHQRNPPRRLWTAF